MPKMSRRQMIQMSGVALIGAWGQKIPSPSISIGPLDAAAQSNSENLFWCEIMSDHAGFFTMLLPGSDLAGQRTQADDFRKKFLDQIAKIKSAKLDKANYVGVNESTIELLKPFIHYKRGLLAAQNAGLIHSLAWPQFFDHTAREAEQAVKRLEKLSTGDASLDYAEVVNFWTPVMSDHMQFMAHWLDPEEQDLISTALDSGAQFQGFKMANEAKTLRPVEVLVATQEVVDFKTAAERGISSGAIRSMMEPRFVDHLRREALRFLDELRRTSGKT